MHAALPPGHGGPSPLRLAGLFAGAALLLLGGLGATDLWAPDEPRYVHVTDQLFALERGALDLVVLRVNGEPYTQKPPLYFWLAALASLPGGAVTEVSARLPSALAGLAAVVLTFALGRTLFDARVGAWGAAFLATVFDFAFLARRARLDVLLTLCVLAAFWSFVRMERGRGGRRANAAWMHGAMGLGVLCKGPVALLPLLAIGVVLAWERRLGELRRAVPAWAWLLSAGPALAWIAAAVALTPAGFFEQAVVQNTVGRFFGEFSKVEPWYFFLYQFPVNFLPWTLLWPLVAIEAMRWRRSGGSGEAGAPWRLLLGWVATWFLFFSFSTGKRGLYLLPCFPAAALLCGAALEAALHRRDALPRPIRTIAVGIFAVLVVAGLAAAVLGGTPLPAAPDVLLPGAFGAVVAAVGAAALLAWWRAGSVRARIAVVVGTVAALELAVFTVLHPAFEPAKSPRPIAESARAAAGPGAPIALYRHHAMLGGLAHYAGPPITPLLEPAELRRFLDEGGRVVATRASNLPRLERVASFDVVSSHRTGRRRYVVLVARDP